MNGSNQKGFGLIEIIVAIAIGMVVFVPIVLYLNFSLKIAAEDINRVEALYLVRSSLEQARSVRDGDWTNISALNDGNEYHFEPDTFNPKGWISDAGRDTVGRYTVWVVLSDVYRDSSSHDIIAVSLLPSDPNTLKVTASVSYPTRDGTRQIELHEYLTNF